MIHFLIFFEYLFLFFLREHAFESDVVSILFLCARGAEENFRTITLSKHIFLYSYKLSKVDILLNRRVSTLFKCRHI
jgi:hypothetical protein